jgi:hypothetical protein
MDIGVNGHLGQTVVYHVEMERGKEVEAVQIQVHKMEALPVLEQAGKPQPATPVFVQLMVGLGDGMVRVHI